MLTPNIRWVIPLLAGLAACAGPGSSGPPGFSADTASWDGLASGATASEAACRALPDGIWARAGQRRACLRYAVAGLDRPVRTAVVVIAGDPAAAYGLAGGRTSLYRSHPMELTPMATRLQQVEASRADELGAPTILLARPGMDGSSGFHADDRHSLGEVMLMDDALSQLRERFGLRGIVLSGFSSGGTIVANLLARRSDIRCAVLDSAPLDLAGFYRGWDDVPGAGFITRRHMADPMRSVVTLRSHATVWVIGDPRDRQVAPALWRGWAAAARRRGVTVVEESIAPSPGDGAWTGRETFHAETGLAARIAGACANDAGQRFTNALGTTQGRRPPQGFPGEPRSGGT
jgi:pimeloyl-ACP methyl ester carboxylesterase